MLYKLLAALGGEGLQRVVVKASFYADIFQTFHLVCNKPFAAYVSAVFHQNLGSLNDLIPALCLCLVKFCLESLDVRGQVLQRKLGSFNQVGQFATLTQRSRAKTLKSLVYQGGLDGLYTGQSCASLYQSCAAYLRYGY